MALHTAPIPQRRQSNSLEAVALGLGPPRRRQVGQVGLGLAWQSIGAGRANRLPPPVAPRIGTVRCPFQESVRDERTEYLIAEGRGEIPQPARLPACQLHVR